MNISDDFIIDCCEVSSADSIAREIFTIDLCPDGYISEDLDAGFVSWSGAIGRIDADVPSLESASDQLDIVNSRQEFEWDLLSIDLDPGGESTGKRRGRRLESKSAKPSAFFTSALVHVAVFFPFAFFPATQVGGTPGHAGNVFSATILSHEDLIPQDECPASVDSAESAPSIAKKSEKAKTAHVMEQPKEPVDMQQTGPTPTRLAMLEKSEPPEKNEESKDREREVADAKEGPQGDALQNSLASMPSTASAERRFIPAAGQGGEAFDSMVLSAIREAIFFPKQAARERRHGEAVVAFAISKDHSVSGLRIAKSSGFEILDEAAIRIIQKAAKKFPRFPDGLSSDTLHYVVPILFKEKGK